MFEFLRTPDSRFENLSEYNFDPNYITDLEGFERMRMHFVDTGPKDAKNVFLCLHGQPTWSYLYRKMIPVFAQNGARVIAPDLFGFGKSDKPISEDFYTFTRHHDSLLAFIRHLNLNNLTLVCQDWGGLLGLTIPYQEPERFKRLVMMNTALATGQQALGKGFQDWLAWVSSNPDFSPGAVVARSCASLSAAQIAAYDAPFPDVRFKAGARRFPSLVPQALDADGASYAREALRWWGNQWDGHSFMAIGMQDTVIRPEAMRLLRNAIKDCPEPVELTHAGHFVQEHCGPEIAQLALDRFTQSVQANSKKLV